MRAFVVSTKGDSLGIVRKLRNEKMDVNVFIKDKAHIPIIEKEMPLVKSPTPEMMNSDLIFIEDKGSGKFADKARSLKRKVIGGGVVVDRLFNDMSFNDRTSLGCGFKLSGSTTNGILTEVGGWFDGEKFLKPYFIEFKYYRLGTGELGIVTPGMGAVGIYKMRSSELFQELNKTNVFFKSAGYKGYVGIEGFINNQTFNILKIHPGLVYPTINLLSELHTTWGAFLLKLAEGKAEIVAVQPDKIVIGILVQDKTKKLFVGTGFAIEETRNKVYKTIKKSDLSRDVYYRLDIGENFESNMDQLKKWEWI